jgi:phytoene synthase
MARGRAALGEARTRLAAGLEPVGRRLAAEGMPAPEWSGKLIRPLVGWAGAGRPDPDGGPLWDALAAVQLAHEASLLHDDVIDGSDTRRGEPTIAASRGVAAALVEGDHLLTAAYRLAARTGSLEWAELFARAVERTVAGEKSQARAGDRPQEWPEYEATVLAKSGELLGAALAAGPTLGRHPEADRLFEAGRRLGLIYQMLDDLLDYCPHVETGKPALVDYRRGLWTWPRLLVDLTEGLEEAEVIRRLGEPDASGQVPLARCLTRLRAEAESLAVEITRLLPDDTLVASLLTEWLDRAEAAVAEALHPVALPPVGGWETLMAEHAKSFRFASRLFPSDRRDRVVGVYAWCRYTDDLVDGVRLPAGELEARLDAWLRLSRRAYEGESTGNALADRVMTEMREAEVPFGYAEELIEGMRMDVRGREYGTVTELWTYTYRVASVVGLWVTELFGIRDPWMLDRAASLGHAMQLTNILRDVGEDLEAGRVYLPTSWLSAYGLDRDDLGRMAGTGDIDDCYRALIERLLRVAEAEYDLARPAIARLPDFYRRPVAVAAEVYRGIHDAIRGNGYDNLTSRAHTTLPGKIRLGAAALWRSRPTTAPRGDMIRAALLGLALLVGVGAPLRARGQTVLPPLEPAPSVDRVEPLLGAPTDRALTRIADLWLLAVEEEEAVDLGFRAIDRLRARPGPVPPELDRLLRAYEGSFTVLRAKHGAWPPARLRNLRDGFVLLDAAVEEAPDAVGPRYIRFMSGFYLPGIFGRGDEVDADLAALTTLLPAAADEFPPEVRPAVASFLLEHGDPTAGERRALEALLR